MAAWATAARGLAADAPLAAGGGGRARSPTAAGGLPATAPRAAGCGGSAAPPPQPRTAPPPKRNAAAPAPGAIHFVGRPDVRFLHASPDPETNVWFVTVVRVDRPLPQDVYGVGGDISISGATHDIPGLAQASGVQRCYWQQNAVASERRLPRDGQLVTVRLKIRGGIRRRSRRGRGHASCRGGSAP